MNTKILSNNNIVLGASIFFALSVIFGTTVYAKSIFDLEFPVAELGGCEDKKACKAYCADEANQIACEDFAAEYGIGEAKAKKQERDVRKEAMMKDGGPGNCALNSKNPEASCHSFCSLKENMNVCVAYGKANGLMKGKELEEAEKVVKALQSGVELPAGCTDEQSCKQTCEEPKNVEVARSCFAFAEKVGLLPEGVDRERAEKVFKIMEEGKSPFKSMKDLRKCENPENDEVMQKCISFAEENGLMSPEDAEIVKKTGGKGPGGCRGKEQCDLYCNEHQEECIQFAETHNLMRPEDKERMQQGMNNLKESITNSPPEVKQCLVDIFGQDKFEKVLSGQSFVGRELGEKMKDCFEQAFRQQDENFERGMMREGGDGFEGDRGMMPFGSTTTDSGRGMRFSPQGVRPQGMQFPPEISNCLKEKLGEEVMKTFGMQGRPDEKFMDAIRECSDSAYGNRGENFQEGFSGGERGMMNERFNPEENTQNTRLPIQMKRPERMPMQFNQGQGSTTGQMQFQFRREQEQNQNEQFDPSRGMIDRGGMMDRQPPVFREGQQGEQGYNQYAPRPMMNSTQPPMMLQGEQQGTQPFVEQGMIPRPSGYTEPSQGGYMMPPPENSGSFVPPQTQTQIQIQEINIPPVIQ